MNEYPILFDDRMVRAIIEGRKTVTRRVIMPQPKRAIVRKAAFSDGSPGFIFLESLDPECLIRSEMRACPYGQPGDRLWVRETHTIVGGKPKDATVTYKADGDLADRWRPSIYMPRWASRILLEVTAIGVERVQDISEADVEREGTPNTHPHAWMLPRKNDFKELWDSINVKRGYGWGVNPWVWVVEFAVAQLRRDARPYGERRPGEGDPDGMC